jgi:hypothetical protein
MVSGVRSMRTTQRMEAVETVERQIWTDEPSSDDFRAAAGYLSLLAEPDLVGYLVKRFEQAPIARYKAKDILRASGLSILPSSNSHVARDMAKVVAGTPLSPVLLVRGDLRRGVLTQVADGYHRLCASSFLDDETDVPCRIATLAGLER